MNGEPSESESELPSGDSAHRESSVSSAIRDPLAALSEATKSHQIPSDRQREKIQNRRVYKGQFGIGTILFGFVFIGAVCGFPNWFGWDVRNYWRGITIVMFMLAPMIGFFTIALADHFGFPSKYRYLFALLAFLVAFWAMPLFAMTQLAKLSYVFSGGFRDQFVLVLVWIPQIIALVVSKVLTRDH